MMVIIFSGLIAAIVWNLLTWWLGIPSSSSHTLIGGFAGAAVASVGFGAVNSAVVLKTAAFIFLAPLVGMIMAFIISLWFIHSFKKGSAPKILSIVVLICVAIFLYFSIETDPAKLAKATHYESYISQVIFYSKNFKWILLGLDPCYYGLLYFFSQYAECPQGQFLVQTTCSWYLPLHFSIGHGGNDAQKVMGIITAALIASGTIT